MKTVEIQQSTQTFIRVFYKKKSFKPVKMHYFASVIQKNYELVILATSVVLVLMYTAHKYWWIF